LLRALEGALLGAALVADPFAVPAVLDRDDLVVDGVFARCAGVPRDACGSPADPVLLFFFAALGFFFAAAFFLSREGLSPFSNSVLNGNSSDM
jgi:hypothetical protein